MENTRNTAWSASKTRRLTLLALFSAIVVMMAVVPNVGYITINPVIGLTTLQIPVIIGAILLGPLDGAFLGLVFGVTSMIQAPFLQPATAFLFNPFVPLGNYKSAIIALVPRVLIGVVAAYVFRLFNRFDKTQVIAGAAAGLAGSLTTSVLVLVGLFFFFSGSFGKTAAAAIKVLAGIFVSNSILEMVVTAIVVSAVSKALLTVMRRSKSTRRA